MKFLDGFSAVSHRHLLLHDNTGHDKKIVTYINYVINCVDAFQFPCRFVGFIESL